MKKRIAILASRDYGPLTPYPDDALLCESFNNLGHEAQIVCWDDESVDYTKYDGAVVRACWDYDRRLPEFLKRMEYIHQRTVLLNPYETIRENTDKRYLLKLKERGVPIVPSIIVEEAEELTIPFHWQKVIVKPTVSASGRDTSLFSGLDRQGIYEAANGILKQGKCVLLQEYLSSVEEYGERSSVLIAGNITFTMKKTPETGGYLVHRRHGGTYSPVQATSDEKQFTEHLLSQMDTIPLYMRVDYLRQKDGQICLLELEQIEPNLYLRENEEGLKLLVQETLKRI